MKALIIPLVLLLTLPVAFAGTLDLKGVKTYADGVYQYGSVDIKSGTNLTVVVEVGNTFSSDDDIEIDDIEVRITIFDIDDDSDIEYDFDDFSLEPGERRTLTASIGIPYALDDKSYEMVVSAEGDSDEGTVSDEDTTYLVVVKKDYEVLLSGYDFMQPKCGEEVSVDIEITNTGKEDQSDVVLKLENDLLGVHFKTENIDIDSGSDNSQYSETFNIKIPDDKKGNYPLEVSITYEGEDEDITGRTFIPFIISCGEETTPVEVPKETLKETPKETAEPKETQKPVEEITIVTTNVTNQNIAGTEIETPSLLDRFDDTTILIVLGELLVVFIASFIIILYRHRR